jgi:hypothetical protein
VFASRGVILLGRSKGHKVKASNMSELGRPFPANVKVLTKQHAGFLHLKFEPLVSI